MPDVSKPNKVGIRDWIIAMRPWSLTASAIPVCFGAGLAALNGHWNTLLFTITLLGSMALQIATNLHNTYGDYISGVDTIDSAVTCPQLVDGSISPSAMYKAGWAAFGAAGLCGLALIAFCGLWVLFFGIIGVAGGYYYTNGKKPYKYSGLGPYFVFVLMGPLMAVPAYVILAGHFDFAPLLGSLSIACLVAAIMHANDMRDIEYDFASGIQTLAMQQGLKKSMVIYGGLGIGAFILLGLNVYLNFLPVTCLIVFALLPILFCVLYKLFNEKFDIACLEGWTARFHMKFGLVLALGVVLPLLV